MKYMQLIGAQMGEKLPVEGRIRRLEYGDIEEIYEYQLKNSASLDWTCARDLTTRDCSDERLMTPRDF